MAYPTLFAQDDFILSCGLQSTNTMPAAWEIMGDFGPDQIREAVQLVVDGHESLRSCIVDDGGSFRQRVTSGSVSDFIHVVDLSREERPDVAMKEMMDQLLAHPFDLTEAPLWRGFLARLGDGRSVLGLALAHVIVDGAAVNVFSRDLARALETGSGPNPLQLGAIALEQRNMRRPTREQANWWEAQYRRRQGLPAHWQGTAQYRVESIPVLEARVVEGLGRLVQRLGVSVSTLFGATTALAAGGVLGCPVPMIGFATAQRNPVNQDTIGPLFDHLPVIGGDPRGAVPFAEFVRGLHERRGMARGFRLPCGVLANITGSMPYDFALNYSPFSAPNPHRIGSRGAVLAMPIPTIGRIDVYRATSVAPPVVAILRPSDGGTLSGDVTAISELHSAGAVSALAQGVAVIAQRVLSNPDAPIGQLGRSVS